MTSRIVGTAGLSSTTMPWLVGQLLERVDLRTFPIALICCALAVSVASHLIMAKLPSQLNSAA
jgi:hypothetical protein